jgi:hypothetical protein
MSVEMDDGDDGGDDDKDRNNQLFITTIGKTMIIDEYNNTAAVEASRLRRLRRMNLLQERKLGHYGWKDLQLRMIQYRKLKEQRRREKNTIQHRMARQARTGFKKLDHRYMDGLRHKIAREHWSTEQLRRVRTKDAEQHRIAQAHLTNAQRQQIRKKNVVMHQLARFRKRKYSDREKQYINNIIQYHNQNCKPLGQCTTECNYREIYEYIPDNDERKRI